MLKRLAFLSVAFASFAVGGSQAGAQSGTIVYTTYFYSDASETTQVGVMRGSCYRGNVTYHLTGSQSAYSEQEEAYLCGPNGPEPL